MKYRLLTFGKATRWVGEGVSEFIRRHPNLVLEQVSSNPVKTRKERMFSQCGKSALRVVLDKSGKALTSERLAQLCKAWQQNGRDVCFLIGDDVGFAQEDLKQADLVWSLSPLTFPHQLTWIVVCEQLYRAHTINSGHNYHRA